MHLSVTLILLQIFGNAFVSAQNVCSTLPDVPHAQLTTESQKDVYQKGDTIRFSCEIGHTSGRPIRYVCTNEGWVTDHVATCKLKPCVLPDEILNGYYQIITGEDFVFGTTIKYFCNEGYQMISKEDTRTCLINQWSNHLPVCEPLRCEAPPADQGLTVQRLPDDDSPILPDRFLTFSCDAPGMTLKGSSTLICGKDGKWDKPFPACIRSRDCGPPPVLENGDTLTSSNVAFAHNARVQYQCQILYIMEGGPYKTCFNGEWTGEIKCLKPCTVDSTVMDPHNIKFRYGYKTKLYTAHNTGLTFACKPGMTHDGRREMRQYCHDGVMLLPTCY